jgi:hypothetical protein
MRGFRISAEKCDADWGPQKRRKRDQKRKKMAKNAFW